MRLGSVWDLTLAQVKALDCVATTPHEAQLTTGRRVI
jgi:hypothetical protein